ncbi:MAG: hypothetical protein HZA93_20545 [Verrucomicrobia bacterium]|nr:hypothetical protein [Verrucomicrobiota bacterium]
MKILRRLLTFLVVLVAVAVLGGLVALTPPAQAWLAQRWLAQHLPVRASVDSMLADFSSVELTAVRGEFVGGKFTVPKLEATLPMVPALWRSEWRIKRLAAKGWIIELTGEAATGTATPPAVSSANPVPIANADLLKQAAAGLRSWLRMVRLPAGAALDDVALEGDVVLPTAHGPAKLHVSVKAGGLVAERPSEWHVELRGAVPAASGPARDVAIKGRVGFTPAVDRGLAQVSFAGRASSLAANVPGDLEITAVVAVTGDEAVSIEVARSGRRLGSLRAALAGPRLTGSWNAELRESDLAAPRSGAWPKDLVVAGEGTFDAARNLADLHLAGRGKAVSARWESLDPSLARAGQATVEAEFEVTRRGSALRFERLALSFVGAEKVATAVAKQPFQIDRSTWAVTPKQPEADWLEISLRELPVVLLPDVAPGLTLTAGRVSGDLALRTQGGTSTVSSSQPLAATGLAMARDGQQFVEGLEATLALRAERAPQQGWRINAAPLVLKSSGEPVALIEASLGRVSEKDSRVVVEGKWSADLDGWAKPPGATERPWWHGRLAAGEFKFTAGYSLELKSKFTISGRDRTEKVVVDFSGVADRRGAISFRVPVRMEFGTAGSDFTVDGTWTPGRDGPRIDAEVSAVKFAFEHATRMFGGAPMGLRDAAAAWLPTRDRVAFLANRTRDAKPFWGDWSGAVRLELFNVTVGAREFSGVRGTVLADRQSLRLENGRAALLPPPPPPRKKNARGDEDYLGRIEQKPSPVTLEGAIAFEAAAEQPYQLTAKATFEPVDDALLFAGAPAKGEPVIEGKFAMTGTLTGAGANRDDLFVRSRGELRFVSHNGIVRLLRANVAEAMSVDATAGSEAWERLGSAVGAILGVQGGVTSGKVNLSKAAEAVLNFSYRSREFAFDEMTLTASRTADGAIDLDEFEVRAAQLHLTGSGRIRSMANTSLAARPLELEVRVAAKGSMADNLGAAGLLSSEKDSLGYARLRQPLRFGGTWQAIDATSWRELLVEAAKVPPAKPKK